MWRGQRQGTAIRDPRPAAPSPLPAPGTVLCPNTVLGTGRHLWAGRNPGNLLLQPQEWRSLVLLHTSALDAGRPGQADAAFSRRKVCCPSSCWMSHLHDAAAAWRNTPGQCLKGHCRGESVHCGESLAPRNPTEVSKRIIRAVLISVGYFFPAICTSCVLP